MGASVGFVVLLLSGIVSSTPTRGNDFIVTEDLFPEHFAIYTSEYDVIDLFCPLNALNFPDFIDPETVLGKDKYLLFIEAEILEAEDKYDYKGTYVIKNKKATKLLDNGRDFAAKMSGNTQNVYIATTDGIYRYNAQQKKAEKFGEVTDSLIGIGVVEDPDFLYVLTEDKLLYKVTNEGKDKEIVSVVKDAVQIVLDHDDNLFFMDGKKDVYVMTKDGVVTKIQGLPANPSFIKLVRPAYPVHRGIPIVTDRKVFELSPNGTSGLEDIYLQTRPTGFSVDAGIIQYYAYEKKIYEYNIRAIAKGEISMQTLKNNIESSGVSSTRTKSRKFFNLP